jgi:long-chain acyl-CoA synthetase
VAIGPWIEHYPAGVPAEINPDRYPSLNDLFEEAFRKYREQRAFESMGAVLTYAELDRQSASFAAYLQHVLGLKRGERIALQMPNLHQWVVAMCGSVRAGLVVVNTNPLYTSREMEYQFRDAGVSAVVILANFAANLQKILHKVSIRHVIITEIGDLLGGFRGAMVNFAVKTVRKMVPPYSIPEAIPFRRALRDGAKHRWVRPELSGQDLAVLQYTGGTTGTPKGAMLTHRNLIANLEQLKAWLPGIEEGREIFVTSLPLYHIYAFTLNCLFGLMSGAFNVLIPNPRDMPRFIGKLRKYRFTVTTGVNTLYNALLHQADFGKIDFSAFKIASAGGMAVQDAVALRWREAAGVPLIEGYGLSETSPLLCSNPLDGRERTGSIGMPIPSTDLRIVDEEGRELPPGEPGEIVARGPQVTAGYWGKEEENKAAFFGEYFRTGDIGIMEGDGFFRIVDRKKEMINVSGLKVYPNEVENVLASHPGVRDVGVVAVTDERSAEAVKAFVVKKEENLAAEELIAFCRERLAPYKVPRYLEFRDELPKSNIGKILRRVLKEEAEAGKK